MMRNLHRSSRSSRIELDYLVICFLNFNLGFFIELLDVKCFSYAVLLFWIIGYKSKWFNNLKKDFTKILHYNSNNN